MKVFIVLVFTWLSASAQVESGTLIVVNVSKNEIVVAADSRSSSSMTVSDDRCKITTLGDHIVFAAAGNTARLSDDSTKAWDSHAIANDIYHRKASKNKPDESTLTQLAMIWGNEVKSKLKADLIRDRDGTLRGNTQPGTLEQGLFIGFDKDEPLIVGVAIKYSLTETGDLDTYTTITEVRNKSVQLGRSEIASELFAKKTQRAIAWMSGLRAEPKLGLDGIAVPAIEAVKFSIKHYGVVTVGDRLMVPIGGPVDAVKLTPTGMKWLQKKPNCPK